MGVFWVDASVRFKTNNFSHLHKKVIESDGMAVFTGSDHSVYSVTMDEMFHYLPMYRDSKMKECFFATAVLMYRTKKVISDILKWWVACALSKECIWNRAYSNCPFAEHGKNRWTKFGFCSRYDQSALSILLYNAYVDVDQFLAYRIVRLINNEEILDIEYKDNLTHNLTIC